VFLSIVKEGFEWDTLGRVAICSSLEGCSADYMKSNVNVSYAGAFIINGNVNFHSQPILLP